ncbi:MAG: N-acetyltransferase family protein [Candidatus Thorarchaeota archaeon]|jgi:GNAT superfamily N-acetyltransferase
MKIREATRADAEWVLHHRLGLFRESGASEDVLDETNAMTKYYLSLDWTEDFRYFLAENRRGVVGGCGLSIFRIPPFSGQRTGLMAYLFNMYVEPQERRMGVGSALLKHMIDVCRNEGIHLVVLHASEIGRSLFGSFGFRKSKSLMHLPVKEESAITERRSRHDCF